MSSTQARAVHACGVCRDADLLAADFKLIDDESFRQIRRDLVEGHPSAVDKALLALTDENDLLGSGAGSRITLWLFRLAGDYPDLNLSRLVAAGVIGGLLRAEDATKDFRPRRTLIESWSERLRPATEQVPRGLLALWTQVGVFAALSSWEHSTERLGVQAEIVRLAGQDPQVWARSLPWLFRVGHKIEGLDVALTVSLAAIHSVVAGALDKCTRSRVPPVRLRAQGTRSLQQQDPNDLESWLLDTLAHVVDRQREVFPRPLAGPAASWLGNDDLEDLIRGSARRAVREFSGVVKDQGAAEEEGLTQQLLALLTKQFEQINHVVEIAGGQRPLAQIALAQRTVPKAEEQTIGADLGILVDADLPDALRARYGDLVQVKKSNMLTSDRLRADSWRIDVDQLGKILDISSTAVYWLIQASGDVLAVPGKLLMAIHRGRSQPGQATFTARYADIRHAAIPLGQHLVDLILGMWIGSDRTEALDVVSGSSSRTRPRHILEIAVRRVGQDRG